MTLAQSTRFLASCCKTTSFTVLVDRVDNPIDAGVSANCFVLWVDADDFEVLVGRILVDPVGIEDTQVGATTTNALFSGGLERSLILQLVDTLVGGLA